MSETTKAGGTISPDQAYKGATDNRVAGRAHLFADDNGKYPRSMMGRGVRNWPLVPADDSLDSMYS